MTDLDVLRQAQLLLGQYGFLEEQEAVGKAIRIITATSRRLGLTARERPPVSTESQGDRLKRLRERAGLSRGQMADLCGVITNTVRAHENSQGAISPEAAEAYAKALGSSPEMILHGRD
ncbi:MAG TPA: helix-turn-helix transcriptional regulator [Caulobacteraceae bacterium]|nr:helix-turn-helix transcriptional regulator [Caulobacteraceae bacterium]